MARKKRKAGTIASTRITDEEVMRRLEREAPDVLTARVSEADFDAVVEGILKEPPYSGESPHFYCRPCGDYHPRTHPHHAEMQSRRRLKR